ncbi:hypothetical protein B9Z19DRAFT_984506, partial [Tuber borchii]
PWFVLLISRGAWMALGEHWFHWTQEKGSGVIVGNLTMSTGRHQIGTTVIPCWIPCCQVRGRIYGHCDSLLGLPELTYW